MPPQPRSMEARLGEQPWWRRHCESLLKRASLTCRRPAISVRRIQTLFEYLRDHQELGAFIDLHRATVCAGSGRSGHLVVETVGRFTEYGEDALQRLTAGSTRPTGPLLVASPTHRWGILAAMELHASLHGTMVSYEDLVAWSALWSGSAAPSGSCECARVL